MQTARRTASAFSMRLTCIVLASTFLTSCSESWTLVEKIERPSGGAQVIIMEKAGSSALSENYYRVELSTPTRNDRVLFARTSFPPRVKWLSADTILVKLCSANLYVREQRTPTKSSTALYRIGTYRVSVNSLKYDALEGTCAHSG